MNSSSTTPPPLPATARAQSTAPPAAPLPATHDKFMAVRHSMSQQLAGHGELIERLLVAAITGGHVLIEGSPGLAKTRTVNCFAALIDASFVRVQATPDLLPADLTGTNIYQPNNASFNFVKGPLFNNVVLVDEINRAPPKVQSALLEAMGENQISASGVTYQLEHPFLVIATQNPIEHEGTYPLPEAQLDRFMFFVNVSMPDPPLEHRILDLVLDETQNKSSHAAPRALLNADDLATANNHASQIFLSPAIRAYIVRLITATRGYGTGGQQANAIEHAASPRGSIFLARAAQARAWLDDRDHVTPDDIAALAADALAGRIVLNYQTQAQGISARTIIERILDATPVV